MAVSVPSTVPETRYARSGEVAIAYQVLGNGPFDLVYAPPFVTNVELIWQVPAWAALLRRLSGLSRLILFDKRGTGMSDRVEVGDLETRMDDIRAVMDAAGSSRAAIMGCSEGGPLSILFAAAYPERVFALVLWGTAARFTWAYDYPEGYVDDAQVGDGDDSMRLLADPAYAERLASGLGAPDPRELAWMWRQSASPGAVRAIDRLTRSVDVRGALPSIAVPTLVLYRTGDDATIVGASRYLASHIHGARIVEFDGPEHVMYGGDVEPVTQEVQAFLDGAWAVGAASREPERVLATVLFVDIVQSTERLARIGDAAWRGLLEAFRAAVRELLAQFGGREIDTAGDGFFASFDGPARAIRCAAAVVAAASDLTLDVRTGLHAGECELIDGKVGGIAVHIGARVAALAGSGEVLASSTVRDLVTGSGIEFRPRGEHELKGVPGSWPLFELVSA